jgi:hypothetical protein
VSQPPQDRDAAMIEAAVLELLLATHPAQLTLEELTREVGRAEALSGGREVEDAVRNLIGAGLVYRHGGFVLPSYAAVRCDQLLGG